MGMHQVNQACFLVDESGQLFEVGSPAIFHAQGKSTYLEAEGTSDAWEVLVATNRPGMLKHDRFILKHQHPIFSV